MRAVTINYEFSLPCLSNSGMASIIARVYLCRRYMVGVTKGCGHLFDHHMQLKSSANFWLIK